MSDVAKLRQSRRYKEWARAQLRLLGDVCHLCGHRGATDLDHLVPVAVDPTRVMDASNVRPAHGISGCSECAPIVTKNGVKRPACNQQKGAGGTGAVVKRPNLRGCPECRGERCSNGVRTAAGMVSRCW